jgi:hypothetical protein
MAITARMTNPAFAVPAAMDALNALLSAHVGRRQALEVGRAVVGLLL